MGNRGPNVTDEIEALIAAVHQKHPKWKAPKVRDEVSSIICKNNPSLSFYWPSLSIVQKVLATVRKKEKELPNNPQDKPWSTATLDSYPIPPEALAVVLKLWKSRIEKGDGLTIREAKWAARLSGLFEDIEKLHSVASRHARTELMYELIGHPFDSTVLDQLLMGLPAGIETFMDFFLMLTETKKDTEGGIKDGVEQIPDNIAKRKGGKSK